MMNQRQTFPGAFWFTAAVLLICLFLGVDAFAYNSQPGNGQVQPTASAAPGTSPTRLTAVEAAAINGDRDTLRKILRNGSPAEKASALDALHAHDPVLAFELVASDFRDRAFGTRLQSLQLMDQSVAIDNLSLTNLLREALHDEDTAVSDYALQALSRRAQNENALLASSDIVSSDATTQQLARTRLAALGHDQSNLRELMRNGDGVVQSAAFEALAASDANIAFGDLIAEFQDTTSLHRQQTLELLVRTPFVDRQLLGGVLQQASSDQDPLIKDFAVRALNQKNREDAQPVTTQ